MSPTFHNVPIAEESRNLTAIYAPVLGPLRFTVLPFGLAPAPTVFQSIIEELLRENLLADQVRIYIDDIIVIAHSREEVIALTVEVLKIKTRAKLHVSLQKLQVAVQTVKFLGHIISCGKIEADPERRSAICAATYPETRRDLRRWIRAAAYLRVFIPKFAETAAPLTRKASRKGKLPQTPELLSAFEALKDSIAATAVLFAPVDGRAFELYVDASDTALGCLLLQDQAEGKKPVGYYSKKLTDVQRRWCATDRELLGILWALTTTAAIILGAPVTVWTDHAALTHLDTTATPKLPGHPLWPGHSGVWRNNHHGKDNIIADFLSRISCQTSRSGKG